MMRVLLIIFVILGYLWLAVIGNGSKIVFQWPGLLLLGCGFVVLPFTRRSREIAVPMLCHLAVAALFIYMVARAWGSPVFYLARLDIILGLVFFGVYVAFSTCLTRRGDRLIFIFLILFLGVSNTVVAIYQLKVDLDFNVLPGYQRQGSGGQLLRPSGFFNIHPHFAGFLEIAVLFGVAIGLFARGLGWLRGCAILCAVIALVGILLSQSRGVFVGLGTGAIIIAVMFFINLGHLGRVQWSMRKMISWFIGITVLLSVVGAVALASFGKRFDSVDQALSVSARSNFWAGAIDQWIAAPLIGTGARSFHYRYPEYRPPEAPFHQRNPEFAHNDYLQQGAEYGLVGLLLVLFVLCAHAFHAFRISRSCSLPVEKGNSPVTDPVKFALLTGALAVIGAHMIQALFDFHVRLPASGLAIVFCLAILVNPGFETNRPGRNRVAPAMRWMTACCGIGLFVFTARLGMASWEQEKAYLQIKAGQPEMAVAHLQKAIDLDPINADPLRSLALIRYYRKDANLPAFIKVQFQGKALDTYRKVIAINPFDGFSHIGAGHCEMFLAWHGGAAKAGVHWKSAKQYFDRAIQLAPTGYKPREAHALYRLNRAYYLRRVGRLEVAGDEARLALEEFQAVPGYFVQGGPRGHRANSGMKSARALLKLLENKGGTGTSE